MRSIVRSLLALGALGALVAVACGEAEAPPTGDSEPTPETQERVLTYDAYPEMQIDSEKSYTAVVTTNLGQMTFELLPAEAPLAVNNFVVLARNRYYDGVVFHRTDSAVHGPERRPYRPRYRRTRVHVCYRAASAPLCPREPRDGQHGSAKFERIAVFHRV